MINQIAQYKVFVETYGWPMDESDTKGSYLMDDLNLPIIKEKMIEPRNLSMDEYDDFVWFNRKIFFDSEIYEKWKKESVVNVPFVL